MSTDSRKSGCLSRTRVIGGGVLVVLATAITIVTGWDEFFGGLQQNILIPLVDIASNVLHWFTAAIPVARSIVIFLVAMSLIALWSKLAPLLKRKQSIATEKVKFRDLWLFVKIDPHSNLPVVQNWDVQSARCAYGDNCMERIVSTNTGRSGGFVRFLKCANGHFVGGEKSYDQYTAEMEKGQEEAEQRRAEQERRAQEEYQKLLNDVDEGRLTKEEFDAMLMKPAPGESRVGYFVMPDPPPPSSAQELYSKVIRDFEEEYVKRSLRAVENASYGNPG